jgi:hypothetical protein
VRFVLVQGFVFANLAGEQELARYTATRDMAIDVCVKVLSTNGRLTLKPRLDGRRVGPPKEFDPQGPGSWLVCNDLVFPLALAGGQELAVHVKSSSSGDIFVNGTVYVAEVDSPTTSLYGAVIERLRDQSESVDRWSVLWQRDGGPLPTGVYNPTLTVSRRSDAGILFADQPVVAIGTTGAFKFDAAGEQIGPAGETLIAVASAMIDGEVRTSPMVMVKDNIT